MIKILDIGAFYGYPCANIFEPWDIDVKVFNPLGDIDKQISNAELLIFGGGQDIHPSLYGHENVASSCGKGPSKRDECEMEVYEKALILGKKMLGICRGAQFLCAMNHGWLVQHVSNHAGENHLVMLHDEIGGSSSINMNSYHHQMMMPSKNSMILGWTENRSNEWLFDVNILNFKNPRYDQINPEIVLFSGNCIGFQPHPEYLKWKDESPTLVRKYVKYYLKVGRAEKE